MNNLRKKLPEDLQELLKKLDSYWENRKDMNKDNLVMLLGKLELAIDDLEEIMSEIEEAIDGKANN